jgi:hypothetical protein
VLHGRADRHDDPLGELGPGQPLDLGRVRVQQCVGAIVEDRLSLSPRCQWERSASSRFRIERRRGRPNVPDPSRRNAG